MKQNFSLIMICIAFLTNCGPSQKVLTMEQLYDLAVQNFDEGTYEQAIEQFQRVINENPGTRFATFSYLKMADAHFAKGSNRYRDAEVNYRIFLNLNNNSHLVPYVLQKLIALNYKKNERWLSGTSHDRDPKPFKKIIAEYQRFYLLFPDSLYLKASENYRDDSIESLAAHEFMIGDWYFDQQLYPSAIARYVYLLRQYPNFSKTEDAVLKLIEAYRKNQQPQLAAEFQRVYQSKFKKG